jgi:hypothetical protein
MRLHVAGDVIEDPMAMWRKYARRSGRTIRDYDLAEPGGPTHLRLSRPGEAESSALA